MDRYHPRHELFASLVEEVIGLRLSSMPSANGKRIGVWANSSDAIFLEDMGEGVAQMLGFLTSLCLAENQIFLVEELENDIHPEALKQLLGVIADRRTNNQFILTTISSCVTLDH